MGALFHDAVDLWWERVTGAEDEPAVDLGEFQDEVITASPSVDVFGSGEASPGAGHAPHRRRGRPRSRSSSRRCSRGADRWPPCSTWCHHTSHGATSPTGRCTPRRPRAADLPINGGNGGVPWVQDLERQRHLLQASYADGLVGQVLDQLEAVDLFDEAAVVVTADHGVAFHGEENRRRPTVESLPEIMWTPLIVKAPGQTEASVDDSNVADHRHRPHDRRPHRGRDPVGGRRAGRGQRGTAGARGHEGVHPGCPRGRSRPGGPRRDRWRGRVRRDASDGLPTA